jgi:hypothetical protein
MAPTEPALPSPPPPTLRGVLPIIVMSGVLPYATYELLTMYIPSMPEVWALAAAGTFPAAHSLIGVVRQRRLDIIGIIVVVGIAFSIVATLVGGSPKLLLIRESFVTGALGLLGLSSLLWKRPLIFYIARQMSAGADPAIAARFDALWLRPLGPRTFRLMTLVWAIGWLMEFALRIVMVETLTIPQVLVIGPIVFSGVNVGLFAWTFAYARRVQRRAPQQITA